jgi:Tol biopolymer transport system component
MKIFLALAIANANAQTKPVSLAWQVTHVDQASPSISPDGKRIVYAVLISGKEQIFTMNLDGSNPVQITHDDIQQSRLVARQHKNHLLFNR